MLFIAIITELKLQLVFHFAFLAAEVTISIGFYTVISVLCADC